MSIFVMTEEFILVGLVAVLLSYELLATTVDPKRAVPPDVRILTREQPHNRVRRLIRADY